MHTDDTFIKKSALALAGTSAAFLLPMDLLAQFVKR